MASHFRQGGTTRLQAADLIQDETSDLIGAEFFEAVTQGEPPGEVTAVFASTQAAASPSAALTETLSATAASTQTRPVLSMTGLLTIGGSVTTTQPRPTLAATGTLAFSAVATTTQAKGTLAASAGETFSSASTSTQVRSSLALTGTVQLAALATTTQLAASLSGAVLSGEGGDPPPVEPPSVELRSGTAWLGHPKRWLPTDGVLR